MQLIIITTILKRLNESLMFPEGKNIQCDVNLTAQQNLFFVFDCYVCRLGCTLFCYD
jgi:hypothetical protein